MLGRTGLGEVFAEAMMPCLMYLPTLTDEADSILLLTRAYPALIRLASVRFPGPHQRGMRMRSLDRIMRYGILKGFANAGEYVQIVKMLMDQVATIIGELGIDVAKHIRVRWHKLASVRIKANSRPAYRKHMHNKPNQSIWGPLPTSSGRKP